MLSPEKYQHLHLETGEACLEFLQFAPADQADTHEFQRAAEKVSQSATEIDFEPEQLQAATVTALVTQAQSIVAASTPENVPNANLTNVLLEKLAGDGSNKPEHAIVWANDRRNRGFLHPAIPGTADQDEADKLKRRWYVHPLEKNNANLPYAVDRIAWMILAEARNSIPRHELVKMEYAFEGIRRLSERAVSRLEPSHQLKLGDLLLRFTPLRQEGDLIERLHLAAEANQPAAAAQIVYDQLKQNNITQIDNYYS